MTDFPDDLGCEDADSNTESSPVKPQCMDNRDNDGDGKIDFPNDPGCPAPQADDEGDPCPDGAGCPQCGDGKDNDENGKTDYPDDPGCSSAYDNIEFTDNPTACGQGMVIKQLPTTGMETGALVGTVSTVSSPCGGGNNLPAVAYVFHISMPKVIVASTDDSMTMIDTVLDLRTSMCTNPSAEVACHDDITPGTGTGNNHKSKITKSLQPGTYYLIVGGKTASDTGQYVIDVDFFNGEGTSCTSIDDCGPGLECRVPAGATAMVCTGPVCNDGRDDDGDGKIDYPDDPGCASPTDSTENDVCATNPTSPQCPACANGVDDDQDGDTDYPADSSCLAASTVSEACQQSEPVIVATQPQTMGTTSGAIDDYDPPPGSFNGHACSTTTTTASAPDVSVQLDLPAVDSIALRLSPVSYDSAHILFDSTCTGTPIDCYDSPTGMVLSNMNAGRYYLIVDGWSSGSGTFTLNVSGTIKNGSSCEAPLAQSGALTCNTGYACLGLPGSRICAPTECNDGMDNNGDGKTDFPADPGCLSSSDPVEDTVCPGANCPACSDGIDNDNDTKTDYPMDTGCLTAAGVNEGCPESDAISPITAAQTLGTLVGATDDHDPSCVSTNFADRIYTLSVPTNLQSLVIDTKGSVVDTVLSFMSGTCSEPSLRCDNDTAGSGDSQITMANVVPGNYAIAVDANAAPLDTFILNVKGTIAPGGSCEDPLAQAGVFVCPPSLACNGPMGSRTCSAAQCHDGVDNNGDGLTDFPFDPGCDSASDNSETTVCPGASCPVCSDGIDNDMDGKIDFPGDPRCAAASGTAEGCVDTDPITSILMPQTTGTTVGATNDHTPVCLTTAGVDNVYTLTVPNLDSLTIDTKNSVVDNVLSFMGADCFEPALACDNTSLGSGDSQITRGFVAAGTYTIAVDAKTSTNGTYLLNVSGVISPGASCESPLVATGVLRCGMGFACNGPVGGRTCVVAECIDGLDNNGDGRTDFPNDPGCTSFADDSESSVCPGSGCPECSDGVDNDGDGSLDYPTDLACFSASGINEECPQSEAMTAITQKVTNGNTTNAVNDYTPACASSTHNAPDVAYRLDLPAMASLTLTTSGFDTAHVLLDSSCVGQQIACSDPATMTQTNLAAGTYYVVVDGWSTASGPFTLTTGGIIANGGSCENTLAQNGVITCAVGYACSGTPGARTCQIAACNDMMDNDGDGKTDYPADPGCGSISDGDETDDCFPTIGPNCPVCANGLDDDGDTTFDYPMDMSCLFAGGNSEACKQSELVGTITQSVLTGTTTGAVNDFKPTCGTSGTHTSPDVAYKLDLPQMASLSLNLNATFDAAHTLLDSTCGGTALACSDPAQMTRTNVAAGTYYVVVDGFSTGVGDFTLTTTGQVAPTGSCEGALFQSGAFTCTDGFKCGGTPGSRTCIPVACSDTMDNDGDGKMDFPADPGCAGPSDDDEADDCSPTVGPNCPACSNALDDNSNGLTDFPMETRCPAASFFSESFCMPEAPADIEGMIASPSITGTFVGGVDNYDESCQSNTLADVSYALRLPVPVASLRIDTIGSASSDTVLSLWNAACSTEVVCNDDGSGLLSLITQPNVPAGDYAIHVDIYGSASTISTFKLNVKGTVAPGTACTDPLFASGVLVCPTGTSCTSGTCQ